MADEAMENKQPFSAVVYGLLALVSIFRDIRDSLNYLRNTVSVPNQSVGITHPIVDVVQLDKADFITPFCPYCAQSYPTGGVCTNPNCSGVHVGSIGDEPV